MSSPDEFYKLDYYADLEADPPPKDRLWDGVLLVRHKHVRDPRTGMCRDCPKKMPLRAAGEKE